MNILTFYFHFPPMSGGGSVVSYEITNAFASLGHKVTVLVPDVDWTNVKYYPKMHDNITEIRVETPSRSNLKIAARRCKKNLKEKGVQLGKQTKFDFVFTIFHPFHLVPNAAVLCAKKLGVPAIVKIDDAVYEKSSGLKSIQRKFEKIFSSKSLHDATKILVSNENTRNLISSFYGIQQQKIAIVPNGIDLSLFQTKVTSRKRIVIFSGVMYYHRGLDILLDSIPNVLKEIPDARFVLLGDGPEMKKLQDLVKERNLSQSVEFKGWIDRNQVPYELAQSSVGIGPLKLTTVTAHALPIKVLEYMASSLPIIAKRGTLPSDVLKDGENGFFVEDSSDVAQRIIKLLNDSSLIKKMGSSSYETVQRFSWQNVVRSILPTYTAS